MDVKGHAALVTGGASGLGGATAKALVDAGAKVAVLDRNEDLAKEYAKEIGAFAAPCDVYDTDSLQGAIDAATAENGPARILVNCAGIGGGGRTVNKDGPLDLDIYKRIINVNLIGTFNASRLFGAVCSNLDPVNEDNERGVIIMTASVAAFDGQVGQVAYSASKGGIVGMTLPMARDFASRGIRVCTIVPGVLRTPLMKNMSKEVEESLTAQVQFPKRLGHASEYGKLAMHIIDNPYLNAETFRIDAGIRMAPR